MLMTSDESGSNISDWKETKKDKGDSKKKVQRGTVAVVHVLQYTSRSFQDSSNFQHIPAVPGHGQANSKEKNVKKGDAKRDVPEQKASS